MFDRTDSPPPLFDYTPFSISQISLWSDFDMALDPVPCQNTSTRAALDACARHPYLYSNPSTLLGVVEQLVGASGETSLLDGGSIFTLYKRELMREAPIISGYHLAQECPGLDDNLLQTDCKCPLPRALCDLVAGMIMNGLEYGYMVSFSRLRILKLSHTTPNTKKQPSLLVSPPIDVPNRLVALLATVYRGYTHSTTIPNEAYVVPIEPGTPFVYGSQWDLKVPLRSQTKLPYTGRSSTYKLFFHGTPTWDHPDRHVSATLRSSILKDSGHPKTDYIPVTIKYAHCTDVDAADDLANEAEILQFLKTRRCPYIPTLELYANFYECMHLLCVRPYGVTITANHLPGAINGIKEAVRGLHRFGILLGRIELDAFSITDDGTVIFTSLSLARMQYRITPEMQQQELTVVEYICQEAMRGQNQP